MMGSCKKHGQVHTAFYYWKTVFQLNDKETALLHTAADNQLYLRFFDVVWNEQARQSLPDGLLAVKQSLRGIHITPVIYITNQALTHTRPAETDSLAAKVNRLLSRLTSEQGIQYQNVQIDCDWSVSTKTTYFAFLRAFKRYSGKKLEATIRLHQIKYPERTGVPPVDKGLLMFYNMGKISADLNAPNSIYNEKDAAAYTAAIPHYQLPLDVALPVFSWAIQIREGKIQQLYAKLGMADLSNPANFRPVSAHVFKALKSLYLKGVYIKNGDLFKFEGMDAESLEQAARQVSKYLAPLENRHIIYYEISSTSLLPLYAKDIKEISAHF